MIPLVVIIPTRNRPKSLQSTLEGLKAQNCDLHLRVLDSSDSEIVDMNKRALRKLGCDTSHRRFPNVDIYQKLAAGYAEAYADGFSVAIISGDDDTLALDALALTANQGRALLPWSVIMGESPPIRQQLTSDSAFERLAYAMTGPRWPFWGLRETEHASKQFIEIASLDVGPGLRERLVRFLDALRGRVLQAETPFLWRNRILKKVDEYGHPTMSYAVTDRRGEARLRNQDCYLEFLAEKVKQEMASGALNRNQAWSSEFIHCETRVLADFRRYLNQKDATSSLAKGRQWVERKRFIRRSSDSTRHLIKFAAKAATS